MKDERGEATVKYFYLILLIFSFLYYSCSIGGDIDAWQLKAKDNWGPWVETLPSTCEEPGVMTRIHLGNTILKEEEALHALGHDFQHYFSNGDATYEADGTKTATCIRSNCNETQTVRDVGSQLVASVENVQFPKINTNWSDQDAKDELESVVYKLADQSQALIDQFAVSPRNVDGQTFDAILDVLKSIRDDYRYQLSDVDLIKNLVSTGINNMANTIGDFLTEPGAKALFNAHIDAFQKAHVLQQREHWVTSDKSAAESDFAAAVATIEQLGGPPIPTDNIGQAITILQQTLQTSIPEIVGPTHIRNGLIQQWEDFAQFDGWTTDLQELGYDLTREE